MEPRLLSATAAMIIVLNTSSRYLIKKDIIFVINRIDLWPNEILSQGLLNVSPTESYQF